MEQTFTPQLYKINTQFNPIEYLQSVSQMNDLYEQLKLFYIDGSYRDILQQYNNSYHNSKENFNE
jgi:hypothetical protein